MTCLPWAAAYRCTSNVNEFQSVYSFQMPPAVMLPATMPPAPSSGPAARAPAPSSGPGALGSSSSTARGVGIIEAMARRVGPKKNLVVLNDG